MSVFDEVFDLVVVGSGGGSMCAGLVMRSAGISTWRRMRGRVHWPTDPQPSIINRP